MRILFGLYRDWALEAFRTIAPVLRTMNHSCDYVMYPEQLKLRGAEEWDAIILIGWSWKVPAELVNSRLVVGMHPSDLPYYAGGSPIQNQIIDGIEHTKATLFRLSEHFDQGDIIDKEDIDLRGHLSDVLKNISSATTHLVLRFVNGLPRVESSPQPSGGNVVRRLKAEHSRLANPIAGDGRAMTTKELWNFIRCREDPYPNAFFEDDTGRLTIKHVEFEPK